MSDLLQGKGEDLMESAGRHVGTVLSRRNEISAAYRYASTSDEYQANLFINKLYTNTKKRNLMLVAGFLAPWPSVKT